MAARPGCSEREYLAMEALGRAFGLARAKLRRAIRGHDERRPEIVRVNYDAHRSGFTVTPFEDFVFGGSDVNGHVLLDDRVIWSNGRTVQNRFLSKLSDAIESHSRGIDAPVVVEFGCGRGRNLLWLKKQNPSWKLIGLDISPVSIKLAQEAAKEYGLDIDFRVADVTKPIPELPSADVCYSVHALEQMPRVFRNTVDTMMATASRAVLFFEPVGELYARNLRGMIGRMRLRERDYLDGLHNHLAKIGARVVKAERMRSANNPLNETVEIPVLPS